ncbi:MAG: hypothetical protein AABX34_03460, partial [Nanoarchaeota archaeon]
MFKFLKEKLKGAISKFSRKAGEEAKEEAQPQQPIEEKVPIIKETKGLEQEKKPVQSITKKEKIHEEIYKIEEKGEEPLKKKAEELKKSKENQKVEEALSKEKEEEKKGFFAR